MCRSGWLFIRLGRRLKTLYGMAPSDAVIDYTMLSITKIEHGCHQHDRVHSSLGRCWTFNALGAYEDKLGIANWTTQQLLAFLDQILAPSFCQLYWIQRTNANNATNMELVCFSSRRPQDLSALRDVARMALYRSIPGSSALPEIFSRPLPHASTSLFERVLERVLERTSKVR
jgi:hypothetical protein